MFFINLTLSLKSNSGIICQIIPDVILYQVDNRLLREKILNNYQLEIAVNLGDKIFDGVSRPSCIIIYSSKITNISLVGEYSRKAEAMPSNQLLSPVDTLMFKKIPNSIIATKNIEGYNILNRVFNKDKNINGKKQYTLVDLIDEDRIQRGATPDLKQAFIIDKTIEQQLALESDFIFPTITGGTDFNKYLVQDIGKRIIYTNKNNDIKLIPKIINYLSNFREDITCKEVKQNKHPFWALHRSRNRDIFTKNKKIIGVITADKILVAIDDSQIFPTDGLYVMASNEKCSNEFLVGVLNSKVCTYLYRLLSMEIGRTLSQIKPTVLSYLPIELSNKKLVEKIESIVIQIIIQKKANPQADTSKLEREIDLLVYKLYGLTEEEIKIIEGS